MVVVVVEREVSKCCECVIVSFLASEPKIICKKKLERGVYQPSQHQRRFWLASGRCNAVLHFLAAPSCDGLASEVSIKLIVSTVTGHHSLMVVCQKRRYAALANQIIGCAPVVLDARKSTLHQLPVRRTPTWHA
jgi:hypothetical protein